MRIALISDIHANFEALLALMDVLKTADRVLCLGDFVGYYCQVNDVIDAVRHLNAICILGNHDSLLLNGGCPAEASPAVRFGIDFASRTITAANRRWLARLPLMLGTIVGGRSVLMVHGSPWRPLEDYLYSDNELLGQLDAFNSFDLVAFGQTHRVYQRVGRKPYLLNPGSVGQSRDHMSVAMAMLIDTEQLDICPVSRSYDPTRVLTLARYNGAGSWVTKHLHPSEGPQYAEDSFQ
jgi:putative phosphoesterase